VNPNLMQYDDSIPSVPSVVRNVHEQVGVERSPYMVLMVVVDEVARAVLVEHEEGHAREHAYEHEGALERMAPAMPLALAGEHDMDLSRIHMTISELEERPEQPEPWLAITFQDLQSGL
jgi:hypothetical protein